MQNCRLFSLFSDFDLGQLFDLVRCELGFICSCCLARVYQCVMFGMDGMLWFLQIWSSFNPSVIESLDELLIAKSVNKIAASRV
jgi:hypothetical protein